MKLARAESGKPDLAKSPQCLGWRAVKFPPFAR